MNEDVDAATNKQFMEKMIMSCSLRFTLLRYKTAEKKLEVFELLETTSLMRLLICGSESKL